MAIYTGPYVGARSCTSGPQPGAWGAMDYVLAAHKDDGVLNTGIYNCRSVRGGSTTSLHGEGRAADFGIRPYSAAWGWALAKALVAFSKELGIQCVIFDRRIWSASYPHSGFRRYSGSHPHTDHIHCEFTWARANAGRAATAKHFAKVLGGVKPEDIKIGGGGSSSTYGNPKAKHKLGSRTLNVYDAGTDVRELQELLKKLSRYDDGKVDGYYGPKLKTSVRLYQNSRGLDPDGIAGPKTIKALTSGAKKVQDDRAGLKKKPSAPKFPLPSGHWYGEESSNPKNHSGYYKSDQAGIRKWQAKMRDRGWSIAVDGIFGPGSAKVARQFQAEKGLSVDGGVGRETWDATWESPVT